MACLCGSIPHVPVVLSKVRPKGSLPTDGIPFLARSMRFSIDFLHFGTRHLIGRDGKASQFAGQVPEAIDTRTSWFLLGDDGWGIPAVAVAVANSRGQDPLFPLERLPPGPAGPWRA